MSILVLDDHPMVRKGMISIINMGEKEERILEAGTVRNALEWMGMESVEIVLVDLQLSGESGFDFIEKAKALNEKLKIIVITSSVSPMDYKRAQHYGVDGYIVKDAFVEDILYAIKVARRGEKFFSPAVVRKVQFKRTDQIKSLTEREQEVFELLCKGKSNADICKELFISEATAKKHVSNILAKLNMKRRVEATLYRSAK